MVATNINDSVPFMVLLGFAFCFEDNVLKVYKVSDPTEFAIYRYTKDRYFFKESTLNEVDTYKVLAIVERNKEDLLKGYVEWESTQNNA